MLDFEKLGAFYLGRPYDLSRGEQKPGVVLYDSRDLTTHAVCVGMTGSGKTGLCLGLLEEAAIDGIPALVIDPKGDLCNLLLTFPELRPEDFAPWVEDGDPAATSRRWKEGLASWGQDGDRIRRLRESSDFAVYTPGSDAGLPVSVLASFSAPAKSVLEDRELLRERVDATAASLLALLGIRSDPLRSREHLLLATILDAAWREGKDVDLASLIASVQSPPVTRIGVLELETFYPAKERFELAMAINGLLASPGFAAWMEGEPLDIGRMLHTAAGKPRISIFSIAHLDDAERMFFVSLLLNQTLSWVRTQSGTSSLRAILYMDEIFGYFPPVANPPSKAPLLTLLKQARAFGVGVVLATQNPVDLDYKGLSNAGTWFIGRLQAERDKARLLDGLEGASGGRFDRQAMERILAGLGNRVFLLHNVHDDEPEVFSTRWTLSYLRGPLTRSQIRLLMDARRSPPAASVSPAGPPADTQRPVLPPGIPEFFLPARGGQGTLVYRPVVLGAAQVRFTDAKSGTDTAREVVFQTEMGEGGVPVDWERAEEADCRIAELERTPLQGASFEPLSPAAAEPKNYPRWAKEFAQWLFTTQKLELYRSASLKLSSEAGEQERDFRIRLQEAAHEERDRRIDLLRRKYAPKISALSERMRRAEQALDRETEQAREQKLHSALSIGSTLLGAIFGRKRVSSASVGRAATAARSLGRARKEAGDVERAEENVEALRRQLAEMEEEFRTEAHQLQAELDPLTEKLSTAAIRPKKAHITVRLLALGWSPHRRPAP